MEEGGFELPTGQSTLSSLRTGGGRGEGEWRSGKEMGGGGNVEWYYL